MSVEKKAEKVQAMFDEIASSYNLMNAIMTLGQDQRWRERLVAGLGLEQPERILDLASGTGDIALALRTRYPQAQIFAGDFSVGMLRQGRMRKGGESITWIACDALRLPFADASFDAVTFGYLLRNVESIDTALSEIRRVLKPGGVAACLDTCPPAKNIFYPFLLFYFKHVIPRLGFIFAGSTTSYKYLSLSTLHFETPEGLAVLFKKNGFKNVEFKQLMLGTIALHWAKTPG